MVEDPTQGREVTIDPGKLLDSTCDPLVDTYKDGWEARLLLKVGHPRPHGGSQDDAQGIVLGNLKLGSERPTKSRETGSTVIHQGSHGLNIKETFDLIVGPTVKAGDRPQHPLSGRKPVPQIGDMSTERKAGVKPNTEVLMGCAPAKTVSTDVKGGAWWTTPK